MTGKILREQGAKKQPAPGSYMRRFKRCSLHEESWILTGFAARTLVLHPRGFSRRRTLPLALWLLGRKTKPNRLPRRSGSPRPKIPRPSLRTPEFRTSCEHCSVFVELFLGVSEKHAQSALEAFATNPPMRKYHCAVHALRNFWIRTPDHKVLLWM